MKLLITILVALGLASGGAGYENVSVMEFSKIIKQKDPTFKEDALKVLDKGKQVAIYCRSGRRSAAAAQILAKEGFTLYNLETGIVGWTKEGKKLVK